MCVSSDFDVHFCFEFVFILEHIYLFALITFCYVVNRSLCILNTAAFNCVGYSEEDLSAGGAAEQGDHCDQSGSRCDFRVADRARPEPVRDRCVGEAPPRRSIRGCID